MTAKTDDAIPAGAAISPALKDLIDNCLVPIMVKKKS
jgi:hypothetical protein